MREIQALGWMSELSWLSGYRAEVSIEPIDDRPSHSFACRCVTTLDDDPLFLIGPCAQEGKEWELGLARGPEFFLAVDHQDRHRHPWRKIRHGDFRRIRR